MEGLIATPVTAGEIMLGKLVPYVAIGLLDAVFCTTLAVGWFAVPFRGAISTLLGITVLFLIVILGIGYMISVATKSQLGASQYALLVTLLPTTMLSGFVFPIDQMPVPIQAVTYIVYSRYYVSALKQIGTRAEGPNGTSPSDRRRYQLEHRADRGGLRQSDRHPFCRRLRTGAL